MFRRSFIAAALTGQLTSWAVDGPDPATSAATLKLLREGGVVVAMRHALAPGTFDPPEFKLGNCATQRNLSDDGREQARRIGRWFQRNELKLARVRSSPWCRCIDTATLAFGNVEPWTALGSPVANAPGTNAQAQRDLAVAVNALTQQPGRIEAWVTHQFVLNDLVGVATGSGDGLLLRTDKSGKVELLGRLPNI